MTVLAVAALAILVVMALALVRAFRGPTLFDRILAVNVFGTKTVLMICVLAFLADYNGYLDIALVYALINYVAVIAVLKFYQYSEEQPDEQLKEPLKEQPEDTP